MLCYDAEVEFIGYNQPHKFKLVGNLRECSWESYSWYKHKRKFSANQCSIETTPLKLYNIERLSMIFESIPDPCVGIKFIHDSI